MPDPLIALSRVSYLSLFGELFEQVLLDLDDLLTGFPDVMYIPLCSVSARLKPASVVVKYMWWDECLWPEKAMKVWIDGL
jgi:hypothetical protein